MNETIAPPTDADRERRDTEWMRVTHLRASQGYHARLSELHPCIKNRDGKDTQNRHPKWKFGEEVARLRCPAASIEPGSVRTVGWPQHEREVWVAAWVHCDTLCAEKGLAYARANDPTKVHRKRRVALAEPLDFGIDAPMEREDARAFWDRHRGIAKHAPTTADEQ